MEIHRSQLSNGVRLIAVPRGASSPVAVQVWFRGGARVESEPSLAHLFEHLLFRGGRDFHDCRSVEHELRLLGGTGNALTADEYMCAFLVTSSRYLRRAMHLLSDMVLYAKCDPSDLEKEKAAVIQELKTILDDHEDFAERKFREVIFGGHPLGRVDCEYLDAVRGFSSLDALRYKERFCGALNTIITVVGDINPAETAEMAEEFFSPIHQVEPVTWAPFRSDRTLPAAKLITRKGVEQAHMHIGALAPSVTSRNFRASVLLHDILSHRLWLKIRADEGLAYSAFAGSLAFSDTGYFLVYAGVDPCEDTIIKATRIIFEEMADIKSGNMSDEEAEEVKSVMHAQFDLGIESSSRLGLFLAIREILCGEIKLPDEIHDEIDRVTKSEMLSLAHELWQEHDVKSLLLTTSFPGYEEKFVELRRMLGG